jgi:hypothetical protein
MNSVIVQVPSRRRGRDDLVHLGPGQILRFGRGAPEVPVDLVIDHPEVSRIAGEIVAVDDYWAVSNLSVRTTYLVENLEGAGEHIKIAPRRLDAPVPFEISRLVLPLSDGVYELKIFAPQHAYADGSAEDGLHAGERTLSAFGLNEEAKYFLVLLALCEPRLRDGASVAIPTARQVADRLSGIDGFGMLTTYAVNYHIDYLATSKLRIGDPDALDANARRARRRDAVVMTALKFDLVREEHLAMLPARQPASRQPASRQSGRR